MPTPAPIDLVEPLWRDTMLDPRALPRLRIDGTEPVLPSSFAVGTVLAASVAAAALSASEIAGQRGGRAPAVTLDLADVVRESSARFTIDGRTPPMWDKLSGLYRCADGHVRIHANFAHHRDGALALLGLPTGPDTERDAVTEALSTWRAEDFEQAAAEHGLVVAAVRTPEAWQSHPQSVALAAQPLVRIERIADAPPRAWPSRSPSGAAPSRPLEGLRVLDLTRILAGPVTGRTLAAWGADVLLVNSPHLPNIDAIADTSRGKRSCHLDLRTETGRDTLRALARDADVFLQGYRPGGLAALGFSPAELAELRPGIVVVSLSAYGPAGPWHDRRGFDSLVQTATGLNVAEARAFGQAEPRALPVQALDYGAGYLLAFGALAALLRQRDPDGPGGSWHVHVALAGVGRWLERLGRLPSGPGAAAPSFDGVMETTPSGFGELSAVRHSVRFDGERARWTRPSMPPGSHLPVWTET